MKRGLNYLADIRIIIIVFVMLQAGIKFTKGDAPSTDFRNFYYPNAVNFLNQGTPYETPDGCRWTTNGDISRHGGQPPAYSLLIAAILGVGGGLNLLFIANVLLVVLAILFSYKIFLLVTDNKAIIFCSLWILVLNPAFLFLPISYNAEAMFACIVAGCFYFLVKALMQQKISYFITALIFLWASILTRSINLYMAPFILIPFLLSPLPKANKIILTFVTILFVFATSFLVANDSDHYIARTIEDGLIHESKSEVGAQLLKSLNITSMHWKSEFAAANFELLKSHPIALVNFWISKSWKVWYSTDSGNGQGVLLLFQGIHLLAFWMGIFLILFRRLRQPVILLFLMGILYTNAAATINLSIVRYIVPMAPFYIFTTAYLCHRYIGPLIKIKFA